MKNILYLSLCIVLLHACRKDETVIKTDAITLDSSLLFGETQGMNINAYYQSVHGEMQVDLNADGMNDLKLVNTSWHSPGLGAHFPKALVPLHSKLLIMGDYMNDTFFTHHQPPYISQNLNVIQITNTRTITCSRTFPDDSIYSIRLNNFHVKHSDALGKLHLTNSFSNDSLPMEADSYFSSQTTYSTNMDTLYYWNETMYTDCRAMPHDKPFYVGFVFEDNVRKRLGWLKLIYTSPNQFMLVETAIQR